MKTDSAKRAAGKGMALRCAALASLAAIAAALADDAMQWPLTPGNENAGAYRVVVGVYDSWTGQRLPIQSGDGQALGDSADLGSLEVHAP